MTEQSKPPALPGEAMTPARLAEIVAEMRSPDGCACSPAEMSAAFLMLAERVERAEVEARNIAIVRDAALEEMARANRDAEKAKKIVAAERALRMVTTAAAYCGGCAKCDADFAEARSALRDLGVEP
jgi:hypothetical protein